MIQQLLILFSFTEYEESTFMKKVDITDGDKHAKGKSTFTPKYPVFELEDIDQTILELDRELEKH